MSEAEFFYAPLKLLPTFAYYLLLHGLLLHVCLLSYGAYARLFNSYSLAVVTAFMFSMACNLVVITGLSLLNVSLDYAVYCLLVLDACFGLMLLLRMRLVIRVLKGMTWRWGESVLVLIVCAMFYFMMQNGALIEQLADSWWHMSMVQRIFSEGSIFYQRLHLTGADSDYYQFDYPYLWHACMALLHVELSLPTAVIWHALTPFVVGLTLIVYYHLSLVLSRQTIVALLSTLLFCFIYGAINSYFRVMAWPGNVSYIFMYLGLYLVLCWVNANIPSADSSSDWEKNRISLPLTGVILAIILSVGALTHGVAVALLLLSIGFFLYGLTVFSFFSLALNQLLGKMMLMMLLLGAIGGGFAFFLFYRHLAQAFDAVLSVSWIFYLLLLAPFLLFTVRAIIPAVNPYFWQFLILISSLGLLIIGVDFEHAAALFNPESLNSSNRMVPSETFNGNPAQLPDWEHQIKSGMLFSGLIAVLLSGYMVAIRPSVGTVFLAANALMALYTLISPDFFILINMVIHTSSAYRVQVLIFAPIIFAILITQLWRIIAAKNGAMS